MKLSNETDSQNTEGVYRWQHLAKESLKSAIVDSLTKVMVTSLLFYYFSIQ